MATLTFYALLDGRPPTLRRLRMTKTLATAVTDEFARQWEAFGWDRDLHAIPYEPGYKPEADELFVLQPYELDLPYQQLIDGQLDPDDLKPEGLEEGIKTVFGLFVEKSSVTLYFQSFNRGQLLQRRGRLSLILTRSTVFDHLETQGVQLGTQLAAVYHDGALAFRSERAVAGFLSLREAHREATEREVTAFAEHELFAPSDHDKLVALSNVSWARVKIRSVLERDLVNRVSLPELKTVAERYAVPLRVVEVSGEERVVLPSTRRELKQLLRLLDDDLLLSPLTDHRYQVSSKRRVRARSGR